jgi:hypothetical protein
MQLPDWVARRPWTITLLACALAGLLLGWLTTPLPQQVSSTRGTAAWVVPGPQALSRFDDKHFQTLLTSQAWADVEHAGQPGEAGLDSAGHPVPTAWSLVGIVLTPQPVALVLDTASAKVTRLEPGSALPDGSILKKIESDGITVSRHGCPIHLALFHTAHAAGAEPCPPPAKAGSAKPHTGEHDE